MSLSVVSRYDFPSQSIRIQIFFSMTLHVAPGDGFFSMQRTVIWIFHSMNLHVALSVVCGSVLFDIYIPNIILITMNNMSLWYIFHFVFHVTFFTIFLVLHVFFFINLTVIIKMVMSEVLFRIFCLFCCTDHN